MSTRRVWETDELRDWDLLEVTTLREWETARLLEWKNLEVSILRRDWDLLEVTTLSEGVLIYQNLSLHLSL